MHGHDFYLRRFMLLLCSAAVAAFSFACSERKSEGKKPVHVENETTALPGQQQAEPQQVGEYEHVAQVKRFEGGIEPDQFKARKVVNQLFNYSVGVCSAYHECPADLDGIKKAISEKYNLFWPKDPWGKPYQYKRIDEMTCDIWSSGPDGVDGNEDDVHVAKANRDDLPD